MTDAPKNQTKAVSELTETRRWCPKSKCWLYPTWNYEGTKQIWVSIPD